jgi:hypothetical protein
LDIKRRGVQDLSWTSKEEESKIYLGRQKKGSPRFILDVKRRGVQDLSWTSKEGESKIYLGHQNTRQRRKPRQLRAILTLKTTQNFSKKRCHKYRLVQESINSRTTKFLQKIGFIGTINPFIPQIRCTNRWYEDFRSPALDKD